MITSATTCLRVPCAKNLFCILGVVFDTLFGGGVGYTTELLQLGTPFNNCYYNILLIY